MIGGGVVPGTPGGPCQGCGDEDPFPIGYQGDPTLNCLCPRKTGQACRNGRQQRCCPVTDCIPQISGQTGCIPGTPGCIDATTFETGRTFKPGAHHFKTEVVFNPGGGSGTGTCEFPNVMNCDNLCTKGDPCYSPARCIVECAPFQTPHPPPHSPPADPPMPHALPMHPVNASCATCSYDQTEFEERI